MLNPYLFAVSNSSIIESIQAFSIASNGASTATATITTVDTANTIVIHNGFSATTANDGNLSVQYNQLVLTNSTTVTATFGSSAPAGITIKGYVIEFKSTVIQSIQTGDILIGSSSSSNTATISAVTLANSAVISTGGRIGDNNGSMENVMCTLALTDSTTVTATRGVSLASTNMWTRYYVLEFKPTIITSRNAISNNMSGVTSTNTAITAVDLNKTILFNAGTRTGASSALTRCASLMFTSGLVRGIVGGTGDSQSTANAQVLEFAQGVSSVQSGSITIASGSLTNTATISSIDTAKSALIFSGVTATTSTQQLSSSYGHVVLTNATTVTATRGNALLTQDITLYFMVVTFV